MLRTRSIKWPILGALLGAFLVPMIIGGLGIGGTSGREVIGLIAAGGVFGAAFGLMAGIRRGPTTSRQHSTMSFISGMAVAGALAGTTWAVVAGANVQGGALVGAALGVLFVALEALERRVIAQEARRTRRTEERETEERDGPR